MSPVVAGSMGGRVVVELEVGWGKFNGVPKPIEEAVRLESLPQPVAEALRGMLAWKPLKGKVEWVDAGRSGRMRVALPVGTPVKVAWRKRVKILVVQPNGPVEVNAGRARKRVYGCEDAFIDVALDVVPLPGGSLEVASGFIVGGKNLDVWDRGFYPLDDVSTFSIAKEVVWAAAHPVRVEVREDYIKFHGATYPVRDRIKALRRIGADVRYRGVWVAEPPESGDPAEALAGAWALLLAAGEIGWMYPHRLSSVERFVTFALRRALETWAEDVGIDPMRVKAFVKLRPGDAQPRDVEEMHIRVTITDPTALEEVLRSRWAKRLGMGVRQSARGFVKAEAVINLKNQPENG